MAAKAPVSVSLLHSVRLAHEGGATAARRAGFFVTAVPSGSAAAEGATGPGATPDVIVFDDRVEHLNSVQRAMCKVNELITNVPRPEYGGAFAR